MACLKMILVLLVLIFNVISYIDGEVNDKNSLKFRVIPSDNVIFVRGNEQNICNKEKKKIQNKNKPLHCVVSQNANITWQSCDSFNEDLMSDENFFSCDKLFKNEKKYCRNIKHKVNSNYAVVTIGMLVGPAVEEPHTGCFRCIAEVGNQKIETSGTYTYIDQCGTPTRYDAINPLKICHQKNDFFCQSKVEECRVLPPDDVQVIQNLTTDGKADLILQWKQAKAINYVAGVYGYKITFIDDTGFWNCNRLITKYDNAAWFKDGKYHFSITDNIGYRSYVDRMTYKFTIQSLPSSKVIETTSKMNFAELCENYTKTYKHTPTKCLMVRSIKVVSCIPETSLTLAWNSSSLPSTVSKIEVWYFPIGGRKLYSLSPNATSHTFKNVSKGSTVLIRLKVGKTYTYTSPVIHLKCVEDPNAKDKPVGTPYTQIVLFTLLSVCILVGVVGLALYRTKGFYYSFTTPSPDLPDEKQKAIKVMMVYTEGCAEVEELIACLGSVLRELGIEVLVDIFEEVRVANEGKTNKLVNDFQAADYVVVLCAESQRKEDTDPVYSENYNFVMKNLLLPNCTKDNGKRFIAVSLSKRKCVPPYLKERSYALSSDLEFFLQHVLHGIQTTCASAISRKRFRDQVENIDDIKKEFQRRVKMIKAETHIRCHPRYCCKGTKETASLYSSHGSLMEEGLDESRSSSISIMVYPNEELMNSCEEFISSDKLLSNQFSPA